jgi:hypothetical protein
MTAAFAAFSEPFAWLVRGLVEYGWRDVTRSRVVPQGCLGGLDLSFLASSQGRDGLILLVPAVADGRRCHEDEAYSLEVQLTRNDQGPTFTIRSPDCNYFQEFPFDPANPLWCAGYIHQAISEYVPSFVGWRLGGGELTWGQRQGIPTVEAEPCSASLASWVGDQVRLQRTLDQGPTQGWWLGGGAPGGVVAGQAPVGPMITMGNAAGVPESMRSEGLRMLERPATALSTMIWVHGMAGICAAINIIATIAMFGGDRKFAVISSMLFIFFVSGMTWVARKGVDQYRLGRRGPLAWVAIVYAGIVPICFMGGLPVAIWATIRWRDPRVKALNP